MPPQPDSSSPPTGLCLFKPVSHLNPPAHCLVSLLPGLGLLPTLPESQLNSLPPRTFLGPPAEAPSPHLGFLLNPPPLPWNLAPLDLPNSPDLTQPPLFLSPHSLLLPGPLPSSSFMF
ncbi:unnamed protein product [Gulo gulo]|uniref:Uncharacterized protein n=1 Tax=Gulo gulo TaxID=48420 RepID=A0A9X9M327_GULGU|nr:unnamed protein product [Gulo gulo]